MVHVCTNCSRINPADARFCYHDGAALNGFGKAGARPAAPANVSGFTVPFTFPSGHKAQNFDQLALGCQQNWAAALDILKKGEFEKFMQSIGRADLAQAAREAARFPDRDRGLDQFLSRIPSQAVKAPRLHVSPAEINLGQLPPGQDRKIDLKLANQGMRLVYGSITVDNNSPWLSVGTAPGAQQKLFQFGSDLIVPVHIRGKRLRASNKPLEGTINIESNGGVIPVIVRAEVPVKPFPTGVLASAKSPRQIAEKAKASPKDAAALFESGVVAQWYKDNGWVYPVQGPSATGLGAVQQFFEALGLTPPPRVEISEKSLTLEGTAGKPLNHTLTVQTQEKRPIWAHGTSDQPWLQVGTPQLSGRVATIPLIIQKVPDRKGETLQAKLTITANGNQKFLVPVTLKVGSAMSPFVSLFTSGPAGAAPAAPRSTSSPAVVASRPGQRKKSDWAPVGLLALLFFCLFVLFVVDLCSSAQDNEEHVGVKTKSGLRTLPVYQIKPIDLEPRINVLFTRESQRFGITCAKLMDPLNPRKPKKLTRDERGLTNNTCIWIEGYQFLLGHELPGARYMKEKGILQREVKIDDHTWQSIFRIEQSRTVITQTVRLVVGEHTRLYDTALIHYQVWNQDTKQHQIGLRTMIDTYIGANDGVPFLIPPREDATATRDKNGYLEAKKRVFPQKEIPDFVRAVENTTASATVAEMGLRLADVEPLHQFVICRWPDNAEARWDWDYLPMDYGFEKGREKDSCAVLYWDKKIMNPGEKREMAFTYGLGRMAKYRGVPGDEGGTDLRLLTAGSTQITDTFTATAMVRGGGGKVTLELPAGFSIVRGDQTQSVGTCKKDEYAQVSWRIKSKELGPFTIKAKHDVIGTAEVDLNINTKSIFGR